MFKYQKKLKKLETRTSVAILVEENVLIYIRTKIKIQKDNAKPHRTINNREIVYSVIKRINPKNGFSVTIKS